MTPLTLELPPTLHRHLQIVAEDAGMSVDEFVARATAEKLAALRRAHSQRLKYQVATRLRARRFIAELRRAAEGLQGGQ